MMGGVDRENELFLADVECWVGRHRPYYRVYPAIEPLLLSASLDIPANSIRFPIDCVSVEFSEKSARYGYNVLALIGEGFMRFDILKRFDGFRHVYRTVLMRSEKTIENQIRDIETVNFVPQIEGDFSEVPNLLRIFIGACMLADNPKLYEPIVLNRDAEKYLTATPEQKKVIEERASRIKGHGWAIGKSFEEECERSPHFRKAHLAIFWTGQGRTTPILKMRSGCLVKARKATDMPTGYHDDDDDGN